LASALDREVEVSHGGRVLAVTASRLGGPADAIAWMVRDATQHARLERAKSEFVATASHELRSVLAAAVRGGRSRALVVARDSAHAILEPALDELGIEYHWETTGAAAARVCGERRFEVALVDVGIRNPEAALQALALRGRRLQRAVILFSDGTAPTPWPSSSRELPSWR
jgi:signal transduction histidine kinase